MKNTDRISGIASAAASSATFGLAPFFTLGLLATGLTPFEVLSYRWGIAALTLAGAMLLSGKRIRLPRRDWATVLWLGLLRAATSYCLVIAYARMPSGSASTIHFMYPLAVAAIMMLFFREKRSIWTLAAIAVSIAGAALLTSTDPAASADHSAAGPIAAALSVVAYGGYMVGVRQSRAAHIDSTVLTCCVMGFGALLFLAGGWLTGGVRLIADGTSWLLVLGLALPATALSNLTLVWAIKRIGPTLTAFFGALEPLTAVVIGIRFLGEPFTPRTALGITLIIAAVVLVLVRTARRTAS